MKMFIRVKVLILYFFLTFSLLKDLRILVMCRGGQKHFEVWDGWCYESLTNSYGFVAL